MLSVTEEEFEVLVREGIEAISVHYHSRIKNVAVVIGKEPTRHHLEVAGIQPGWTLYGLYEGVPLTERGENYMFTVPDKITIFSVPILKNADTIEDARKIVKNTVWHEFAHYFGLDEEEVGRREELEGRDKF